MSKYIQDCIRNNSRSIIGGLTKPQQKSLNEIIRGLFNTGTPILRHLAQDKNKSAKKQAEKYSYHLGNIGIKNNVDAFALNKAKKSIEQTTIIAYDLTDISKENSRKMEKISTVFDGSKRKPTEGFTIHGVGINNILVKLEIHDSQRKTLNQTRLKIINEISKRLDNQGIWVFDRGNDDKQFFKDLRQNLKVDFIARLKENRLVVVEETGVIIQVKDLQEGKYKIFLMNKSNTGADLKEKYTLVISDHLKNKAPIRLLSNLDFEQYSIKELVTMYLQRWGIENGFKRIKTKFELEKIRLLSYEKCVNLIALIQLAVVLSTITFLTIQQETNFLITGVLLTYKRFLKTKHLTFNNDSFISFLRDALRPLIHRKWHPTNQISLFSRRQLEKLGSF